MAFSGALTLTDLNDFITPSQACIKPVEQTNKPVGTDAGAATTEIHIDETGSYYEVFANSPTKNEGASKGRKLEQAQISLNDCLACSGCITSAESVLITLQSHTEVLSVLSDDADERVPIISIAPQILASLAAAYSPPSSSINGTKDEAGGRPMTPLETFHRVKEFCTSVLGFAYVFDTTFARHLALKEHVREFLERQHQQLANGDSHLQVDALPLPMLASACPGWICYAEKAHFEMLPFIARTKSPQQVMGTLVKKWVADKLDKRADEIYHVSVMPCYDKKLEASRQDFFDDILKTRDVDCVITTGELELLMKEFGWDFGTGTISPQVFPTPTVIPVKKNMCARNKFPEISIPELLTHPGTSSGSYLHGILHHLISTSPTPLTLNVKAVRNADYEEYILREKISPSTPSISAPSAIEEDERGLGPKAGKVVFKGAKCYGFRNLQNVVRKIGRERGVRVGTGAAGRLDSTSSDAAAGAGKGVRRLRAARKGRNLGATEENVMGEQEQDRKFDYVEVMACPGGCVNGGGQLKPPVATLSTVDVDAEGYKRDWDGEGVAPGASAKWGDREWTKKVEEFYWQGARETDDERNPVADQLVDEILEKLCAGDDAERRRMFRTEYRRVESDVIGLAVQW